MKRVLMIALAAVFLVTGIAWAAPEEFRLYIWSEYMPEDMPAAFEKETGIKVHVDLYESNEEMVAKLQAGGVNQYDLVVPSDYILPSMIELGLVQPLDHSKIPNIKNLSEKFTSPGFDPGNKYSVGYQWGTVGMMYNKKLIKNFEPTWDLMLDPNRDAGSFILLDSIREMMGIGLKYIGASVNTTNKDELKKMADILIAAKKNKNCQGFQGGVGGKNKVVAGTAAAAIVYNGDSIQSVSDSPDEFGFVVPKEGSIIWIDSMAIPAKAPNAEAAYKWINWIMEPKINAWLSNFNYYATPNGAALPLIDKEALDNPGIYPPEETMKNLEFILDLGKDNRLYDEVWTMIKTR